MVWCSYCAKDQHTERDDINGFTCCTGCGRVLDDNVYGSDPTFTKTAGGQSQVEGNFVKDGQSSFGRLGAGAGRILGYQSDSHEKTLAKGRHEIVEILERLSIRPRDDTATQAHRFYTIALERNFTRGRRTQQVAASCIYIVCRQNNKPYMLIDFSDCLQTNVYALDFARSPLQIHAFQLVRYPDAIIWWIDTFFVCQCCLTDSWKKIVHAVSPSQAIHNRFSFSTRYVLGAVFLQLCNLLRLEEQPFLQKPVDPSLFIHRFADRLRFGKKMHAVSNTALRLVASMKRDWMQTGRRPSGICGAALFISAHMHGFERSKGDVVSVVHICEGTLKRRLVEFESTESGGLTAEEFELKGQEMEAQIKAAVQTASNKKSSAITDIMCEHKDAGGIHFSHGLCRGCYEEFVRVSGGMQGGSAPPAFQRAELQRLLVVRDQLKGQGLNSDEEDEEGVPIQKLKGPKKGAKLTGKAGDLVPAVVGDCANLPPTGSGRGRVGARGRGRGRGRGSAREMMRGQMDDPKGCHPDVTASEAQTSDMLESVPAAEGPEKTEQPEDHLREAPELVNLEVAKTEYLSLTKKAYLNDNNELALSSLVDEDDTLSDIDDNELIGYMNNDEEVRLKTIVWTEMNKEYIQEQEAKKAALAAVEEARVAAVAAASSNSASAAELAAAAAAAVAQMKKDRKQKRADDAKRPPAQSAAEATRQMLESKKLSTKVDYSVLAKLFDSDESKGHAANSTTKENESADSQVTNMSSKRTRFGSQTDGSQGESVITQISARSLMKEVDSKEGSAIVVDMNEDEGEGDVDVDEGALVEYGEVDGEGLSYDYDEAEGYCEEY